jgi:hypothetical protein
MCLGWTFQWVAPDAGSPQPTFYAAVVAGNDASGTNGDYVYTEAVTVEQTPVDPANWSRIKQLFR